MDLIEREEIIEVLRQQPELLQQEAFELLTVSDVIGLHVPDYVHKALPLRDAFFLGLNPQWIDFFDNLQASYCQLISNMHKNEITSNHLHPEFLNNWYREDADMEAAYNTLRGIAGWSQVAHDDIAEALVDVAMGIPAGQTVHDRRATTHGNVVSLRDYRLRSQRNARLH